LYGFLSGVATSAITQFLPLFAEEDQLWSDTAAGSVVAVVGLAGIFSRIFWSRHAERAGRHGATLRTLSLMTAVAGVLLALAAAGVIASWVLIPVALLVGLGAIAWNAVGMLAVMEISPPELVGRGTGVVLFGFLLGLAVGAPAMGLSGDLSGSYIPGWLGTAVILGLSALIAAGVPDGYSLDEA
jgi:MFS family permease